MTFDAKFQEVGELYADFGAFMRGEKGEKGDKGEKGEKGEDANTDLFANAVIGSAEGEVVRVDDVSPLEHHPLVKVKSRNLFNNVDDFKGFSHSYVGRNLTVTGQYTNKFILLEDGKKYTFSCQSTRTGESGGGIFLRAYTEDRVNYINVGSAINVLSPTLTTTLPIGYPYLRITFYGYYSTDDVDTGDATYTDIMLEEGANSTGYIPFVEPASVTVTTCGKNLWNNGNVSINGSHQTLTLNQTLLKGITYTFSADVESTDTDATTCMIYTPDLSMSLGQIQRGLQKSISFTPSENIYRLTLYSSNTSGNGTSDTATFSNIQLEVGNVATDFEEHKGVQTLTPNADGTVEGITSLAPTMTLHTNNADVVIHCEYNRDTNKALLSGGATVTKDGTVVSQNADFGEVAEWGDGNPLGEDRTGYFVCADVPVHGIVMKKATSTDDVKGVTILAPAFAGNYTKDKLDSNGNLLPKYSYVAIIGFVPVIDKGRCSVGGRCMPDDDGCAVPSSNSMGYQVVQRIDDNRVLIIIEPNGDMVQRIKTKVNEVQNNTANVIKGTAQGSAIAMHDISPIEHSVGVKLSSKNLFDGTISKGLGLTGSGNNRTVYADNTAGYKILKVEPNTTYCISGDYKIVADGNVRVASFTEYPTENSVSNLYAYGSNVVTFTTTATDNYLFFWFILSATSSTTDVNIQLEKSSTATEYTPFISDAESSRNILNPRSYVDSSVGGSVSKPFVKVAEDGGITLNGGLGDTDTYAKISYTVNLTEFHTLSFGKKSSLHNAFWVLFDGHSVTDVFESEDGCMSLSWGTHTITLGQAQQGTSVVYLQLEKGISQTEYVPFVNNFSTVEVSRYGKNLFDKDFAAASHSIWVNEGGGYSSIPIFVGKGNVFTVSYKQNLPLSSDIPYAKIRFSTKEISPNYEDFIYHQTNEYWNNKNKTYTAGTNYIYVVGNVYNEDSLSRFMKYIGNYLQIEIGTNATAYEPYKEPITYTANADGIVEGVKSISPNMTLISSNNDAVIDCNYNIDTKTYIDNKFAELQALILEG